MQTVTDCSDMAYAIINNYGKQHTSKIIPKTQPTNQPTIFLLHTRGVRQVYGTGYVCLHLFLRKLYNLLKNMFCYKQLPQRTWLCDQPKSVDSPCVLHPELQIN